MEKSSAQRLRQVRMANASLEMLVLRGLPKRPDAMQRYTAIKRRRKARMIQVWYRKCRAAKRSFEGVAGNTTLPSDVSGSGTSRVGEESESVYTAGVLERSLDTSWISGAVVPRREALSAETLHVYASLVKEDRLAAAEKRALAKGNTRIKGGEDLNTLRDLCDRALAARGKRGGTEDAVASCAAALARGAGAKELTASLLSPPHPEELISRALISHTAGAGIELAPSLVGSLLHAALPAPTPRAGEVHSEEPLPASLPQTYRSVLDASGPLSWPPHAIPSTRAAALGCHSRALSTLKYNTTSPSDCISAAATPETPPIQHPWWRIPDLSLRGRDADIRDMQQPMPLPEFQLAGVVGAAAQSSSSSSTTTTKGKSEKAASSPPLLLSQSCSSVYLPPPFTPLSPVSVPCNMDPLGSLQRAQSYLAAPPPQPRPLFSTPSFSALKILSSNTTTNNNNNNNNKKNNSSSSEDRAISQAWMDLACSPLSFLTHRYATQGGGLSTTTTTTATTRTPLTPSPKLDGSLSQAAKSLGVLDPWSTAAALINPSAVTAAVRAAATAFSTAQEMDHDNNGVGGAIKDASTMMTESEAAHGDPPMNPAKSSRRPNPYPIEELVDLTSHLYSHASLDWGGEEGGDLLPCMHQAAPPGDSPSNSLFEGGYSGFPSAQGKAGESIELRVSGAYEVLRRGVVASDALACLEGEDERGNMVTAGEDREDASDNCDMDDDDDALESHGDGEAREGGGSKMGSGKKSRVAKRGRPPMSSLADLTREVSARIIQRAWRRLVAYRKACAEVARRRRLVAEGGGRAGKVRSAVLSLLQVLQSSGVSISGMLQEFGGVGGGEGFTGGGANPNSKGDDVGGGAEEATQAVLEAFSQRSGGLSSGKEVKEAGKSSKFGRERGGQQPVAVPVATLQSSSAAPNTGGRGGGSLRQQQQQVVSKNNGAPPLSSQSKRSSISNTGRSSFLRYSERDAIGVSSAVAAAVVDSGDARPTVLLSSYAPAAAMGGGNTLYSSSSSSNNNSCDSSVGLIVLPREQVMPLPPITIDG